MFLTVEYLAICLRDCAHSRFDTRSGTTDNGNPNLVAGSTQIFTLTEPALPTLTTVNSWPTQSSREWCLFGGDCHRYRSLPLLTAAARESAFPAPECARKCINARSTWCEWRDGKVLESKHCSRSEQGTSRQRRTREQPFRQTPPFRRGVAADWATSRERSRDKATARTSQALGLARFGDVVQQPH